MTQENAIVVTHQQALEGLQNNQSPEAKAILDYVKSIKDKNIAVLGSDEVFTIRDGKGEVKAFKRSVHLSIQNGGLIQLPAAGNPLVVSAQGYEIWAEGVGASVVFPPEVLVGNEWRPNPHAERDQKNRRILAVHSRAVAMRYTSIGVKQAIDWTTIFDTPSYRMIDLLAKAKQYPQAFKVLPIEMKPEITKNETWAHYPFDESMNLWMDTSHDEVMKWLGQIMNREKKSMDFAQTFSRRNSLKHLSGIQKAPFDNWLISVIAWRETGDRKSWDFSGYSDMQESVAEMIKTPNSDKGNPVELKTGVEKTSDDQDFESVESEVDPEDSPESDNKEGQENKENDSQKSEKPEVKKDEPESKDTKKEVYLPKDIKQAVVLAGEFPNEYKKACEFYGIKALPQQLSPANAVKVCKKVSELIDMQD